VQRSNAKEPIAESGEAYSKVKAERLPQNWKQRAEIVWSDEGTQIF
jgi:hypothetical protein